MNNAYALIMAGGEGTRFAPLSTAERPKQFLNFMGEGTFIQQTVRRIGNVVPHERILIATNSRYEALVKEQLPDIPDENIVLEPFKKNTAPCIAYAARAIERRDPEAVMAVLPCDHAILDEAQFCRIVSEGLGAARKRGRIVTIGIRPEWPATEYGYIKTGSPARHECGNIFTVESFVEKPDIETATSYVSRGGYYWNSGIFIFTAKAILKEFAAHLPSVSGLLDHYEAGSEYRDMYFERVESVSIDYGIMEKTSNVSVISGDFGWSDVGTWQGLNRLHQKGSAELPVNVLQVMNEQLLSSANMTAKETEPNTKS